MHIVARNSQTTLPGKAFCLVLVGLMVSMIGLLIYAILIEPHLLWDASVSAAVQTLRTPMLDELFLAITLLGDLYLHIVFISAMALWLALKRYVWLSVALLGTSIVGVLSVSIIKIISNRARPCATGSFIEHLSLPSGHATTSLFGFGVLALLVSWGRHHLRTQMLLMALGMGLLVATSRVYLAVHWPSDVLAGCLLACILLMIISWLLQREQSPLSKPNSSICLALGTVTYLIYYALRIDSQALKYAVC